MEKSNLIKRGFYTALTAGFFGLGLIYGCKDAPTGPLIITIEPEPNSPTIELSVSPSSGISPLETYVAGKCEDPDNDIADYRVMKGDSILTRTNPTDTTINLNEGKYLFYSKCRDGAGNEVTSDTSYIEVTLPQKNLSQTAEVIDSTNVKYIVSFENITQAELEVRNEPKDSLLYTRTITSSPYEETFLGLPKGSNHFIFSAPDLTPDTATATVSQYLPMIDLSGLVTDFYEGDSLIIDLEDRVSDTNPEDNPVPIIGVTPLSGDVEATMNGYLLKVKENSFGMYEVEIKAGSDEGGLETRIISGKVLQCEPTPVTDKIAFLRLDDRAFGDDGNKREVWLMGGDGSNQVKLTEPGTYANMDFSPDGRWIVLERANSDWTGIDIYLLSSDGSCSRNLTPPPIDTMTIPYQSWFPHFSPDGSKILFQSNRVGNLETYLINVDGSGLTNLTNNPAHDRIPMWSPDGTKIAFARSDELYLMNSDGSNQRPVSTDRIRDIGIPSWSPDGTQIAFSKWGGTSWEIYVINTDGTGFRKVTADFEVGDLQWSPGGNNLLFNSAWDRSQDNYVIIDFGGVEERLERIRIPGNDFNPRWSPDGEEFSFTSTLFGNWEIVKFKPNWDDFSQSILTRLTTNPFSDHSAVWSPQ